MPRRRLAAALLSGLFTLQLVVAGVSAACPMWDHAGQVIAPRTSASQTADVGMNMAGMMDGMVMPEAPTNPAAASDAAADGVVPVPAPCEHPASPGECQTMAPCSVGFLAPPRELASEASVASLGVVAALVAMPASVSTRPDLPHPRA